MSIQDAVNAAYRIKESAHEAERRTAAFADSLRSHSMRLAATVRGARTGEQAVQEVNLAERSARECGAALLSLQSSLDAFIRDITK